MKSKKYLLKITVLLFIFVCTANVSALYAQDGSPESQKIGVGIKAGGIYGVVDFNVRFWTESNFGFEVGYGQRYSIKEM